MPRDLVPEHERELRLGQVAVQDVQIRPAHGAGPHADPHLTWLGGGDRALLEPEPLPRRVQHHRSHARDVDARLGPANGWNTACGCAAVVRCSV